MISCREAVEALEGQFLCSVCFHDYEGRITAFAGAFPLCHRNRFCERFRKPAGVFARCCQMEAELSRAKLGSLRRPFVKRCHAGVYELALPVFFKGSLTGALFIGPFKALAPPPELGELLKQEPKGVQATALKLREGLPELEEGEAARLAAFAELLELRVENALEKADEKTSEEPVKRKARDFIDMNFRRDVYLKDMAKALRVGGARCCELLRESLGRSFTELLTERRLEHAKYLLKESMAKNAAIASECGFQDAAYFHRVFKARCGETPKAFRIRVQGAEGAEKGRLRA